MRAECAATTTAIACEAEHVPSCRPICHLLVLLLRKQTVPRRSGCKGEVGIVASLRPAEIWAEDEVSLKRRYITGSHVAHVTGSVWQRLSGALAHDLRRCQLDAEACVGGRLQQLPCDERAVRGALFYACRWFQQCKQKRAPTPCSPISLSLAAFVSLLLWRLRDMRGMFAAASWSVHPQAIVNAMRHALLSRVHH